MGSDQILDSILNRFDNPIEKNQIRFITLIPYNDGLSIVIHPKK